MDAAADWLPDVETPAAGRRMPGARICTGKSGSSGQSSQHGRAQGRTTMSAQTFCLYSIAAVCLVWGVLGLRFALSDLAANAVLALLLFNLDKVIGSENLLIALMLSYPLYWGLAFAIFKALDRPELPSLNVSLRLGLGCLTAFVLVLYINWAPLAHAGNLFHLTYLVNPEERAPRLAAFFKGADEERICDDSYDDLMRLAVNAGDKEVTRVLFTAFSTCKGAATTVSEVVQPVIDDGDAARLEFFLENGLTPDMEVFGYDYANGTALAYAATAARRPEIVRMIFAASPEKALKMKYLHSIVETLKQQDDKTMLSVLNELGIR